MPRMMTRMVMMGLIMVLVVMVTVAETLVVAVEATGNMSP